MNDPNCLAVPGYFKDLHSKSDEKVQRKIEELKIQVNYGKTPFKTVDCDVLEIIVLESIDIL